MVLRRSSKSATNVCQLKLNHLVCGFLNGKAIVYFCYFVFQLHKHYFSVFSLQSTQRPANDLGPDRRCALAAEWRVANAMRLRGLFCIEKFFRESPPSKECQFASRSPLKAFEKKVLTRAECKCSEYWRTSHWSDSLRSCTKWTPRDYASRTRFNTIELKLFWISFSHADCFTGFPFTG